GAPAKPTAPWWIWAATKVSPSTLLILVLKSIVPSGKTLTFVLPVSMEVEPVSPSADSFACSTHTTSLSFFALFFAGAALAAGTAIAQAATKKRIKRRISPTSLRIRLQCRQHRHASFARLHGQRPPAPRVRPRLEL